MIPIYDALYDDDEINHYLVRHEQGASHMADGYARVKSGSVGVCLATSGPGATNLVTGIMTAYMDSIPLLAITGQVGSSYLGKDSFQESHVLGITSPITKHNYLVDSIEELPRILKEAYSFPHQITQGILHLLQLFSTSLVMIITKSLKHIHLRQMLFFMKEQT